MVRICTIHSVTINEPGPYGHVRQRSEERRRHTYVNPDYVVSIETARIEWIKADRLSVVTVTQGPRLATYYTREPAGRLARRLTLTTPST